VLIRVSKYISSFLKICCGLRVSKYCNSKYSKISQNFRTHFLALNSNSPNIFQFFVVAVELQPLFGPASSSKSALARPCVAFLSGGCLFSPHLPRRCPLRWVTFQLLKTRSAWSAGGSASPRRVLVPVLARPLLSSPQPVYKASSGLKIAVELCGELKLINCA
ncbi:hypothetical protein SOVF_194090, partial [Spinacia oleracea]